MKYPLIALIAVFALALPAYKLGKRLFPPAHYVSGVTLEQLGTSETSCTGKEKCLVVYVTPWCPSCHQQIDLIRTTYRSLQSNPAIGFKVVVGADTREKLVEMAQTIGIAVDLDPTKVWKRQAGVEGVPAWLVADRDGRVLRRGSTLESAQLEL